MRAAQNTTDRLVFMTASPWFRPFFLAGLGFLTLAAVLAIGSLFLAGQPGPSSLGDDVPAAATAVGFGLFFAAFGFFLTAVPLLGRMSYRTEIIIDRPAGQFIKRDRTLLKHREESYPLKAVSGADIEEARYRDGDLYFVLRLRLDSGESLLLDRFSDRESADRVAGLIRDRLSA